MDVLQRRGLGKTNVFHTDVWASGAYWRDRRPDTSTREMHICDAYVEVAGVEVASELLAVGLINLCGCLRGVRPPITTIHAVTHLAETSFSAIEAKCSSVELAYFATGLWAQIFSFVNMGNDVDSVVNSGPVVWTSRGRFQRNTAAGSLPIFGFAIAH
jgi:hypothetical protein